VLYARGFKYDFSTGKLVKTGTLVVRTDPSKSKVFLNDDKDSAETPVNIRFLLPDDYTVKIAKDGYQTWTKRLTINSQFVTWAAAGSEKVFLFYNTARENGSWQTSAEHISADNSEIVFKSSDRAYLLHTLDGALDNLGEAASIKLPYLPNGTPIRWQNANQIWQLLQTEDHWPLTPLEFAQIKDVVTTGDHTAILINSDLYLLEVSKITLIDKSVSAFTVTNQGVWYTQGSQVKQYDFNQASSTVIVSNLPVAQSIEIIRAENQLYLILDHQLYQLVDELQKVYGPVTTARWYDDAKRLMYSNGNEIYLYDPITQNSQLALRSLTPINDAQLNWKTGYVFYQNEGYIKAAELDTRNGQNQFNILKLESATNFVISPNGSQLFVVSPGVVKTYTIR
jgi:hypothetical protein